jgi:hypothetical protein
MLDIKLPERSVPNILSFLKSNNMPARVPGRDPINFNCWGFTAFYCEWEEEANWLDSRVMEKLLEEYTKPISKEEIRAGDIAVFRRDSYLTHTAVMLPDGNTICHKPGGNPLCIDTIEEATNSYGTVTYARAIEKVNEGLTSDSESV